MASQWDGGRTALGGFLYQIVATIAMGADFKAGSESEAELSALLSINGGIRVHHEKFDADAMVEAIAGEEGTVSLVQFKYSSQTPPPTIPPSEYKDIVLALSLAGARAEAAGKTVAHYLLVTNRKLGAVEKAEFGKKRDRGIADQLAVTSGIGLDRWVEVLTQFGRTYGRHDHEIQDGIFKLTGQILHTTLTGSPRIERTDIVEAIADYREAKPIRYNDIRHRMEADLQCVANDLCPTTQTYRRRQWDEISQAIFVEGRALLLLKGDGGSGKSTGMVDWLLGCLRPDSPYQSCVSMTPPETEHASWIADIISDWSDLRPEARDRRQEGFTNAINRLMIANPGLDPPILVLGLDGLDETTKLSQNSAAVRRALRWFRREDEAARQNLRRPVASLIVTARNHEDIEDNFLNYASSGFDAKWQPATVHFDDFSNKELSELAQSSLGKLAVRFRAALDPRLHRPNETIDDAPVPSESPGGIISRPIAPEIISSLKHPSMWRAFLELSISLQNDVLDGTPAALDNLAHEFCAWFCKKLRGRQQYLATRRVMEALANIACKVEASLGPFQFEEDWCCPARDAGFATDQARALFDEAKSAGFVRTQARSRWTWRHGFCSRYLRNCVPTGWE
jgi:hypothetical protein